MKYTEFNQDGSVSVEFTLVSVNDTDSKAFYWGLKDTGYNSNFEDKKDIGRF